MMRFTSCFMPPGGAADIVDDGGADLYRVLAQKMPAAMLLTCVEGHRSHETVAVGAHNGADPGLIRRRHQPAPVAPSGTATHRFEDTVRLQ